MSDKDEEITHAHLKEKLDAILANVEADDPAWWQVWLSRLKYPIIALTWLLGVLTHKWGLFQHIKDLFENF